MTDEDVTRYFQQALDNLKPSEGALIINNLTINIIDAAGHNAKILVNAEETAQSVSRY